MHELSRDLLLSSKAAQLSPRELQQQLHMLNAIVYHTENWETFCEANELIDINRHRIITRPHLIENILREPRQKPFVFVHNKN